MNAPLRKADVQAFWDQASCGEAAYLNGHSRRSFDEQAKARYKLEPYIFDFARFAEGRSKKVLEIGVGLGADHEQWARAGANLSGVDLTPRAIDNTRSRFAEMGLKSDLRVGDAESLPFPDNSFDIVYSYGVIHHTADTAKAAREIIRVLKPGGRFSVMIYQRYSLVGLMLWARYGLARGKPFTSLSEIYANYLESPGTKAYTPAQARELFRDAEQLKVETRLSFGDLLEGSAGQRHTGTALSVARLIWPRRLLRAFASRFGLLLMIEGCKGDGHTR